MDLETKVPPGPLFRIGRAPGAWTPPDWAYAKEDGTFGNRFDDPKGLYRVLYASSQRLGCFLETLARFRIDLELLAELKEMQNADEEDDDPILFGKVPRSWIAGRHMGIADSDGQFADLYCPNWIAHLRSALAPLALKLGMSDLDLSCLLRAEPRSLTQEAGRLAYLANFDGVCYASRYGHSIENWAIFENFKLGNARSEPLSANDPDFLHALEIFGLELAP